MDNVSKMIDAPPAEELPADDEDSTEAPPQVVYLSRDEILAADESAFLTEIPVPEWGGSVFLRVMSGAERDALEEEQRERKNSLANFRSRLLVRVLADENGVRLFSDRDAEKLGKKDGRVLERLFIKATKLNAVSESDIEDLEKN